MGGDGGGEGQALLTMTVTEGTGAREARPQCPSPCSWAGLTRGNRGDATTPPPPRVRGARGHETPQTPPQLPPPGMLSGFRWFRESSLQMNIHTHSGKGPVTDCGCSWWQSLLILLTP